MSEIVSLIGCGSGKKEYMTQAALAALSDSNVIIGAARLISEEWMSEYGAERITETSSQRIAELIEAKPDKRISVVFSGDTGLYSGATPLGRLLKDKGIEYRIIPGLSSVQLFAAAYGIPWQDMRIVSAHGRQIDIAELYRSGDDLLILTDNENTPDALCKDLVNIGSKDASVAVGEDLGTDDQKITRGTAEEISYMTFSTLSVLYVENGDI